MIQSITENVAWTTVQYNLPKIQQTAKPALIENGHVLNMGFGATSTNKQLSRFQRSAEIVITGSGIYPGIACLIMSFKL